MVATRQSCWLCSELFDSMWILLKALEMNGQELLGREVKLDLARERGPRTPNTAGNERSFQKGDQSQGPTIFVRGFDTSVGTHEESWSWLRFEGVWPVTAAQLLRHLIT